MGYAEKRGMYWRARYKIERGRYGTVVDANGEVVRFTSKRKAEKAADEEELKVRRGEWRDPSLGGITFGDFARRWYEAQDLAASTLQNYRRHIEGHLLPTFDEVPIVDILAADIDAWEKREKDAGYELSSIKSWRGTLHLILGDAVEEGIRESNPAMRRRGRGKRAGRSQARGAEKAVTDALGLLLIAERMALLSGRDDEFVATVLLGYTGIRWGELVGLETEFVRSASVRVEWQLYELDTGELHRCPPKDDSRRTIDVPEWLAGLLSAHISRTQPKPCDCHGLTYVFHGHRAANGASHQPGAKLVDVARRAGVATGTVSNVLNRATTVSEPTRARVQAAITDLGYVRGRASAVLAAHWRRTGFATWLFRPATTGWYPRKSPQPPHPVPVLAEPWPGVPIRGRGAHGRADSCWLPIAPRLTPHGLRHTHKTTMTELGIPPKLMDDRMGHEDGSVQARYSHITPAMRQRLLAELTALWEESLNARRNMSGGSPVAVLDGLLTKR